MKQKRMSLATIEKLSRAEMKRIIAGDKDLGANQCATSWDWCDVGPCTMSSGLEGQCRKNTDNTKCYCAGGS